MFKNLKQLLMASFLFLAHSFGPCWAMEKNQVLPEEIHCIIISFVPASDLVYLPRVSKTWQKLVSKTLEFFPEKYLELCEVGFEKKKYSKILDPIFTNPTLYKKFINYVLQQSCKKKFIATEKTEWPLHREKFHDKVAELKTEKPENLFGLAWFVYATPSCNIITLFQNINPPSKRMLKSVFSLLLSLGAPLDMIENVEEFKELLKTGRQLYWQCNAFEFSEHDFQKLLKKLEEHYIVANFIVITTRPWYKNGENDCCLRSPLHFAVQKNNYVAIQLLVTEGSANVNLHNYYNTPLSLACEFNHCKAAEFLLNNGAILVVKVESIIDKGNSYLDMLKILVKYGAPLGNSLNIAKRNKQLSPHINVDEMIHYLEELSLTDKTKGK